jgi:hypothetical protein
MGIFIYLSVSHAVTPEEWEKVYQEALFLARNFPLAEIRSVPIHGVNTRCLVHTDEREHRSIGQGGQTYLAWYANGDSLSLKTAEMYSLRRNLVTDATYEPDAGDAMLDAVTAYMDYPWDDARFQQAYGLWGAKTQGEPYHLYLLAIACLIEDRLGTKAFVYGDITRGQCKKAVELANKYLSRPIRLPDRCSPYLLCTRVSRLPFPADEQIAIYVRFYLGAKDAQFGEYMRYTFSEKPLDSYWTQRFEDDRVGTGSFHAAFSDYLGWGFSLEKLFRFIKLAEDGSDHEAFINCVMDAQLHVKEKDCSDALAIDPDSEAPYSIYTLLAQFAFGGARNRKIDRYIPLEDIRRTLRHFLGDKCNVDGIIDAYLADADRKDDSELLNRVLDKSVEKLRQDEETYDVSDYTQLRFYEKGDSILPAIAKSLGASRRFLDSLLAEPTFAELMAENAHKRCEWLANHNHSLRLRDTDWEHIYSDIKQNPISFSRYYPLIRADCRSEELMDMCTALMLNDALFDFTVELALQDDATEE